MSYEHDRDKFITSLQIRQAELEGTLRCAKEVIRQLATKESKQQADRACEVIDKKLAHKET